jgi:aquaporin Z
MIFAGGHISGAHYNPAVSVAVWVRGKLGAKDLIGYVIFQCAGAWLATLAVQYLKGCEVMASVVPIEPATGPALLAEFLGAFALAFVVLNVATARGTANNSFYGLAIGLTVTAMAYAVGGISGGAFNPAVALGLGWFGIAAWSGIWIYLVANFAAGAVAGLAFRALVADQS